MLDFVSWSQFDLSFGHARQAFPCVSQLTGESISHVWPNHARKVNPMSAHSETPLLAFFFECQKLLGGLQHVRVPFTKIPSVHDRCILTYIRIEVRLEVVRVS